MHYLENTIIRLRAPEITDLDLLYNWENNTELWHVGDTLAPFSRLILKKYLETAHLDIYEARQLRLMIDVIDNKQTIGAIDLFDFDPNHSRAGIGILVAENSNRQKGYAKQALVLTITYCFEVLGLHQLYCNIGYNNKVSLQLFKKCGFQLIGLKKQWVRNLNTYTDEYMLQLINNS